MHALINRERSDREAGFTLIELLVVVAIIGILAAIAIPVFLNQRASARDASVKADLNGIAKVMETVYADQGAYPTSGEANSDFANANPVVSNGNLLIITPSDTGFTIQGCNAESDNLFEYDSLNGGLAPEPVNAPTAPNDCDIEAGATGEITFAGGATP